MARQGNRKESAKALLESIRGGYIIGQALDIAIQHLEALPSKDQPSSNIDDMKLLRDEYFPIAYQSRVMSREKREAT